MCIHFIAEMWGENEKNRCASARKAMTLPSSSSMRYAAAVFDSMYDTHAKQSHEYSYLTYIHNVHILLSIRGNRQVIGPSLEAVL